MTFQERLCACRLFDIASHLDALETENAWLREALDESVKLQSHYAKLLNMHDGGGRLCFVSSDEWLARLAALARGPR